MGELGVRLAQEQGKVDIRHIDGKRNIADIFTKEIKDSQHFQNMAFTITTPRLVADMPTTTLDPVVIEGGVKPKASWTRVMTSSWVPSAVRTAIGTFKSMPTAIFGVRAIS